MKQLLTAQRAVVTQKGGIWPPPSDGMHCFAEYFLEADGDQMLWDVRGGLRDGEYLIYYYTHAATPRPSATSPTVLHLLGACLGGFAGE